MSKFMRRTQSHKTSNSGAKHGSRIARTGGGWVIWVIIAILFILWMF